MERAAQPGLDTAQWQWLGNGSAVTQRWLAVALVQHVLVAARGWCCLAEGPAADKLAPLGHCPQPQPPAPCQIRSLRWAQHLPHPSQGSAENLVCITNHPQDSFIAAGLLAHASPRLWTGTSVVQMHLTGVRTPLKNQLSPRRLLPAIPQEKQRSWPGSNIKPLPLLWAQVLLQTWTWLQ